jgi:hypothetical protein
MNLWRSRLVGAAIAAFFMSPPSDCDTKDAGTKDTPNAAASTEMSGGGLLGLFQGFGELIGARRSVLALNSPEKRNHFVGFPPSHERLNSDMIANASVDELDVANAVALQFDHDLRAARPAAARVVQVFSNARHDALSLFLSTKSE